MRLLLDTHLLVWVATGSVRLPPAMANMLADAATEPVFSTVSLWEISIKFALRRRDFPFHPRVLRRALLANGYEELDITSEHVFGVAELPPLHRDPFDRLLIAQAVSEGLTFATADAELGAYPAPVRLV